jgi:hypothetical protein
MGLILTFSFFFFKLWLPVREFSKNPCNEIQLDALFTLSLFRQSTSTCFGHICNPSLGDILYIYINWYMYFLVDCLLANPANRLSTEKHNTYQLLYIYSIPPDDVLQICPKHVEVEWRNKLRINSASSWISLQGFIEMDRQQNMNFSNIIVCPDVNCCFLNIFYTIRNILP